MVESTISSGGGGVNGFPKLMKNENVVMLMENRLNGTVVHQLKSYAVPVGQTLNISQIVDDFSDFHGTLKLTNS